MIHKINDILQCEKIANDFKFVIFDLDDTLYSEKSYVKSGFKSISEKFCNDRLENELWSAFLDGHKAIDYVFESDKKTIALETYRNHFPNIKLYDGVFEMLVRLKNNGKVLGLITDGRPEGQRQKIKALGLEKIFDFICITDELGGIDFRKPNDSSFRIMQIKSGISFEDMVYIGDNSTKDFIAPEKLGMIGIHFNNKDGLYYKS